MKKIQFLHGSLATGCCPMALREAFDGQADVPTPDLPLRSTTVCIETYKPEYRDDYLEGNTRLKASIAIYRSLGFVEIPLRGNAYERCDILMEYKKIIYNKV